MCGICGELVAELRRIYDSVKRDLMPLVAALPTRENPEGELGKNFFRIRVLSAAFARPLQERASRSGPYV